MALRDIKRRIKSVKNTSQITKAMEVVSATKMRKSQTHAIGGRPYAIAALEILQNLLMRIPAKVSLMQPREIKKTLLLAVTSDRGLAGAFNANVLRAIDAWRKEHGDMPHEIATVGKKALQYFTNRKINLVRSFSDYGDYVSQQETEPLADFLIAGFEAGAWDRVIVFYTNFRTTLRQEVRMVEVLPVHIEGVEEAIKGITPEYGRFSEVGRGLDHTRYHYEYTFEPSPTEVLERLVPTLVRIQLHHIILESNASEHSARMVAMKNASENAKDLISELTISYNKARQAGITRELTEITAGKEAIENK